MSLKNILLKKSQTARDNFHCMVDPITLSAMDIVSIAEEYYNPIGHNCDWTIDEDGIVSSQCGNKYCFEYDIEKERNGYTFCPNCGRRIIFNNSTM